MSRPIEKLNLFFGPAVAQAVSAAGDLVPCGKTATDCTYEHFLTLIANVLDYLVIIASPLAAAAIVWGGVVLVMSGANEGQRARAKEIIYEAVIGFAIILAAFVIVRTIFYFLVNPNVIPADFK